MDQLVLLLHAQLRCSRFGRELGEVLVGILPKQTHPAEVCHALSHK